MNDIRRFIFIFLLFWSPITLSMDNEPAPVHEETANLTHTVLIFLDDTELAAKGIGVVTSAFLYAFDQQASPIIVSASIINHILTRKFGFETILLYVVDLEKRLTHDWIVKKLNNSLYLLIPKKHLAALHINAKEVETYTDAKQITTLEQELGFKVNHMKTVRDFKSITPQRETVFISKLEAIFVSNDEYRESENLKRPQWFIYIDGHGILGSDISGMPVREFELFLNFIKKNLKVKLLYYQSCYGAGINSDTILKDFTGTVYKSYPFPIIMSGLTDAITYGRVARINISKYGSLALAKFPSYDGFVAEAVKDLTDYKKLVNHLLSQEPQYHPISGLSPQIKRPGLPWLSVVDDTAIVSIRSNLVKNRPASLDIETLGKKRNEIRGILLYVMDVPFELIINVKNSSGNPPEFVSMIPGTVIHHIKKISSSYYNTQNFLDSFLRGVYAGKPKIFIFDEIKGTDGSYKDVVVRLTQKRNTIDYMDTNNMLKKIELQYGKIIPSFKTVDSELEKKKYIELLKSIKSESEIALLQGQQTKSTILGSLRRDLGSWWMGSTTPWRLLPFQKKITIALLLLPAIMSTGFLMSKLLNKRMPQLQYKN
jgi:hypothetical protein